MTTIAYRDGLMAADTLAESSGLRCRCTKLFRLDDGRIVGISGGAEQGHLFVEALRRGARPDFSTDDRSKFHALVMHPDGRVEEWETERIGVPVEDPFYAIGSGRDAAMGAMCMGADPVRAIEIAKLCDINTGGAVMHMRCGKEA